MRKILLLVAFVVAAAVSTAADYQNFKVAVYITVYQVNEFADPSVLEKQWAEISSKVHVGKVYIEVHRDRTLADEKVLDRVKAFFVAHGVQVAAGSAFSDTEGDEYRSFCYTNPAERAFVQKVSELAARHFDEFILDDFFFNNTKMDSDIAAKGNRSWTDFRLGLMDEAGSTLIVKAAKAVNPKVKVVIKFPNWYEHFQGLGFDLDKEPKYFDGIYTGTETRDPSGTDQYLQQYESFQIIRYFDNIKPGGNGGGWVDTYGIKDPDRYAEQLWDTLLAKAPEITLFNWTDILEKSEAGDRSVWAKEATSLDYGAIAATGAPSWAAVAGAAFTKVDRLIGQLGTPIGVDSYRPYQSTGEDFLHNYIGMIGIPINLHPEFPKEAKTVLLTEDAKFDPEIVAKIEGQLVAGKNVVITSGLLRALKGKGIEDICETEVLNTEVLSRGYMLGFGVGDPADLAVDPSAHSVVYPQVRFLTNDAWGLASAMENGVGYPVLLVDQYSKGRIYVWVVPDDFRNLYTLPKGVTAAIKDSLMGNLFVRIDGPNEVALFPYDNGAFVIESYRSSEVTETVTLQGNFGHLRNLDTGEEISAFVPDESHLPPWLRSRPGSKPKSYFKVSLPAHSFAGFTGEK